MSDRTIMPSSLLNPARILLDVAPENKKRIFELVGLTFEDSGGPARGTVIKHLLERERLGSTVISDGVAVPHARIDDLKTPLAAYIRIREPMLYDNPENKVKHMFVLLAPDKADGVHLKILSLMSRLLTNREFIADAENCQEAVQFLELIQAWEIKQNFHPQRTAASGG